ncbi:MAG TPA: GAF domain-containing protein [Xanthobacteraceae bacterium]|nr:GAF domain-containing protein [Xanthobacteraceae bacterium]
METQVTELTRELNEAREQQTATSEVLQVISSSPGDLQPVFGAMLENAVRICDATFGNIYRWDGETSSLVASNNTPPAFADYWKRSPIFRSGTPTGRMVTSKTVVHITDCATSQDYVDRDPAMVAAVKLGGVRTFLAVPMLKDDELIGAFALSRQEVRPFTDKQIELVRNFAAQAVIAIENARLLNELRQRTDDLTESLERQTATTEVLQVINLSPGNLAAVFDAMLEKAMRVCGAAFGVLATNDGKTFRTAAMRGVSDAYARYRKDNPPAYGPGTGPMRILAGEPVVHVVDLMHTDAYRSGEPNRRALVDLGGARTSLHVALSNDKALLGSIQIYRQEVRPFSDKEIALLQNFAAQAVIAMENARLLNELRERTDDLTQRTADLTEALEQQTATSDVLKVISGSTFDLQKVLDTLVESAARLCEADMAAIVRPQGSYVQFMATYRFSQSFLDVATSTPVAGGRWTLSGRVIAEGRTVQILDVLADPEYTFTAAQQIAGFRTGLGVPLLREGTPIGVINLWRAQVRPFTRKQIELVTTFADQAVIAIENTRLLKELRERTEDVEKLNQQLEERVANQVGEIERMGRLRRFLPPQVADLIVASGAEKQLESHRREITALFCDLRGFTGFSESSDPEDVMALLRDYHAAIGEIIIKYSGTLERYAGDGVMVVFNDPVPVEQPALQAVLMALEMRNVIGTLTEKWRRLGHEIGFGIGIAHGFATLGTIGFEGRFDYAAIGTVSNVASRLCDEAKPGQILISPRVLMAVEDDVSVEPVGEFTLKGIRRPLAAYNVLAAKSAN